MLAFDHIEPEPRVETAPSHPMLWHDYANLFPLMEGEAFSALVEDIRANGVREPIVMYEGKVLDGRNRYLAARECGREYPLVEYDGADPLAYVISLNLKRRHLSESQRAMVAAKLAKLPAHRPSEQNPANVRTSDAAVMLKVSTRSVEAARFVHRDGAAPLIAAVEADQVSVSAAAEVAKLPEELQAEIVAEGPHAVREVASDLRKVETSSLNQEEVAELREAVVEAAMRGLKGGGAPRKANRNPDYQPNPAFDAMAAVAGSCNRIIEQIGDQPDFVVSGFLDQGMRERNIATFTAAHAALGRLLEACRG